MAISSTVASGGWYSSGTWVAGTIPSFGATAFLSHHVTIATAVNIGESYNSAAIWIGSAGSLNVTSNMTFYMAGHITASSPGVFSVPSTMTAIIMAAVLAGDQSAGSKIMVRI